METFTFRIKNLTYVSNAQELLAIPELTVASGDRIGIVGGNGQGKSTLLHLLAGKLAPTSGSVVRTIDFHYFEQIKQLEDQESSPLDGALLSRMSVPLHTEMTNLSGGEAAKYRLTESLSNYREGLLLDEPTTHLDQNSIKNLVEELRYYFGTLIIVSHDRFFLNQLVDKIWEVADHRVTEYPGNYDDYQKQKQHKQIENQRSIADVTRQQKHLEEALKKKQQQIQKAQKVSAKQQKKQIKPSRLSASKQKDSVQKSLQKNVKTLEKRMARLVPVEKIATSRPVHFPQSDYLTLHNRFPIMADELTVAYGETLILDKINFQVPLGKKIALVGKNGTGKSTLLNAILMQHQGITVSPKAVMETYRQLDYQLQRSNETIIGYLSKNTEFTQSFVRSILHQLGFNQGMMEQPVNQLSGGEMTKLAIAAIFIKPSNILLLDEPTNFIDLNTIEALEHFLAMYPGTVIFTSHDRQFVEKTADDVWHLENGHLYT